MAAEKLSRAREHVKELEDLDDYYFGADRDSEMEAAAAKATKCIDSILGAHRSPKPSLKAQCLFLKGRALSFLPGQEALAQDLLSQAVKLEPQMLAARNALGEVHWNMQSYEEARECFENALEICGPNAVSLRSLSMVLRAVISESAANCGHDVDDDAVAAERSANFTEALEKAKAAVALDASDPQNWETLGNAYVGDFFVNARRPDELSRALIAYSKAEGAYNKLGKSNPALQLNQGMAASYIEDYDLALRSFRKAQEIGAANAAREAQKVMELVQHIAGYTQRKGDLKSKQLNDLLQDFKQAGHSQPQRSLRDVKTSAGSRELPLMAKVVNIVDRQDQFPMIILCCDAFGDFFALSLYNAKPSKIAESITPMKSIILIRQLKFHEVRVSASHKTWSYPCIRVAHPGDLSVVGGSECLKAAAVASKFTAAALPRQPQAIEDTVKPISEAGSVHSEQADVADPVQEQWIDEADAKMKKEVANAKARAKPKANKKRSTKKKESSSQKVSAGKMLLETSSNMEEADYSDSDDSVGEIETTTGSESYLDNSHGGGSRRSSASYLDNDLEGCMAPDAEETVTEVDNYLEGCMAPDAKQITEETVTVVDNYLEGCLRKDTSSTEASLRMAPDAEQITEELDEDFLETAPAQPSTDTVRWADLSDSEDEWLDGGMSPMSPGRLKTVQEREMDMEEEEDTLESWQSVAKAIVEKAQAELAERNENKAKAKDCTHNDLQAMINARINRK